MVPTAEAQPLLRRKVRTRPKLVSLPNQVPNQPTIHSPGPHTMTITTHTHAVAALIFIATFTIALVA